LNYVIVVKCDVIMVPLNGQFVYIAKPTNDSNKNVYRRYFSRCSDKVIVHAVNVTNVMNAKKVKEDKYWNYVSENAIEGEELINSITKKGCIRVMDSNLMSEKALVYNSDMNGMQVFSKPFISHKMCTWYIPIEYSNEIILDYYAITRDESLGFKNMDYWRNESKDYWKKKLLSLKF